MKLNRSAWRVDVSGAVFITLLAFVVGCAVPTYANEPNDPFGKNTIEANEGSPETIWNRVRQQLLDERFRIAFCIECPQVAELKSIVKEARKNEGKALLAHLNRSINLMTNGNRGTGLVRSKRCNYELAIASLIRSLSMWPL